MAEISPLGRRMIEDMTVRNLSPATQRSYLAAVSKLSRYFGRSPDCLIFRYGSFALILACPRHVRLGGNLGNAARTTCYNRFVTCSLQ
jgi:hypothetical protein